VSRELTITVMPGDGIEAGAFDDADAQRPQIARIIAKVRTIAAWTCRARKLKATCVFYSMIVSAASSTNTCRSHEVT
jgi:hypothetical protein